MARIFSAVKVVLVGIVIAGFACAALAQQAETVAEAKLRGRLAPLMESAELHFSEDGSKLLVLRHLMQRNEPILSVHRLKRGPSRASLGSLYYALAGSDMFSKGELQTDPPGFHVRGFRFEGIRAALNPDGNSFLTSSYHSVQLWNIPRGERMARPLDHDGSVLAAFTKSGKRLLTAAIIKQAGGVQWQVRLWDAANGEPIGEASRVPAPESPALAHMTTLLWAPDGKSFITANGSEFDMQPAKAIQILGQRDAPTGGRALPARGDFHHFGRDGKTLMAVSQREISLWDLTRRKRICVLATPEVAKARLGKSQRRAERRLRWYAVHPDGAHVLYACENEAQLSDLSTEPAQRTRVLEHRSRVWWMALSRDGKQAATACDEEVLVWNLESGKRRVRIPSRRAVDGRILALEFSPDGRLLATVDDHDVRLWEIDIKR